jgi:hypothetical protein
MKKEGIFSALIVALTMMGCASAVTVERNESYNLSSTKTYGWVETSAEQNNNRNVSAFGDQAIHNAVRQELARRGWREVNDRPDLLVTHDVMVQRTRRQQSDPVYTQPFSRFYYNPYFRRWGTIYYPSQFMGYDNYTVPVREGTLTITLIDPGTDKAVWQGSTTEELDQSRITSGEIQKATQRILKKLK